MLNGIFAVLGLLSKVFGMFQSNKEQATGAALQRGADSEAELKRMTHALDEKSKVDAALASTDRAKLLDGDKNNRDNR